MKYTFHTLKYILFSVLTIVVITSCKKKYEDALPKVQLVSAVPYGTDSVLLTGQVTSAGASAIEYTGFAYSNQPSFSILQRQVLLNGTNGQFYWAVPAFADSTYYFKCFAANSFGYTASSALKYTVPQSAPAIAPCTLTNNQINDNGSSFAVSAYGNSTNPQYGNYSTYIYGAEDITISFSGTPKNGIYTTTSDGSNLSTNQVIITISNFNQYTVNGGQKLYVSLNTNGTITLSSCSLQYNNGSSTSTMWGKVTY